VSLPEAPRPGWKLAAPPVRYDAKTLFDRIDGGAGTYIRAGFVYSLGGDYRKQGMKDPVVIDAYDMGTASRALGMYATERDRSYSFIDIGDEGYLASGSLNFWKGRFYVKLAGYEQGEAGDRDLRELASSLAVALPVESRAKEELAPLALLPAEGRQPHSDGFSLPPLGDVEGLQGSYYAEYKEGEIAFRLFVVHESSPAAAATRYEKAKAYFGKGKAEAAAEERTEDGARVFRVAGESNTFFVLHGALLGGGVDLPNAALLPGAIQKLARSVARAGAGQKP
jgi:hypothetical protein